MRLRIRTILYATDLSPNSAYAFRYAVNCAKKDDAEIVVLHVMEKLPSHVRIMLSTYLPEDQQKEILEEKIAHAKERIEKRLKLFSQNELQDEPELMKRIRSIEVCEGHPAEIIIRKSDEFGCDIIVMGTHGKETWHHTYLGSMARQVLGRIRKPVFVVPLPAGETDITFHDI
ncbi:MAG: universal stress protein [Thermodesulfobacteriota bacterium]